MFLKLIIRTWAFRNHHFSGLAEIIIFLDHASMDPWIHGSMDVWIHASMDIHGSMDAWMHDPEKL